jgi:uncharacterized protein
MTISTARPDSPPRQTPFHDPIRKNAMIDLEEKYLAEVLRILRNQAPNCEVRAFGSRVTGKAAKFSDLDLALVGDEKLDWRKIELLKDSFSASDLPMIVDVIDWNAISDEFRATIGTKYEILQKKS